MTSHDKNSTPPPNRKPKGPTHPQGDAMPPYQPGGVPEPSGDGLPAARDSEGQRPDTTLPPKNRP